MWNDTYFARVTPPDALYASSKNVTDPTGFYMNLFQALDDHKTNYINFHAYMELRMMIFAWKKCSVNAPYIEESAWECAVEIVSGFKTHSRTTLRNTY